MDPNFQRARDFFLQGVACAEAGDLEGAQRQFLASLSLVPGRPSTLSNLGAVQLKLGQMEDAIETLEDALRGEPDDVAALVHLGMARAELGQLDAALAAFDRALTLNPQLGTAWLLRGSVLKDLKRPREAAESLRCAITHGGDAVLARYYLAAVEGGQAPAQAPAHYVQTLFDGYAGEFESHLVETLRYDAPQRLTEGLGVLGRDAFSRALDLGCGTGLCAPLLKSRAGGLDGVDLSGNMLAHARSLGLYDEVIQEDMVCFLRTCTGRYDLVIAADVFVYLGDLDAVFAGVARVALPEAVFCFSIESCTEAEVTAGAGGFVLRPSLRFAHSVSYIQSLAQRHGFSVVRVLAAPAREDQGQPVAGLYYWLVASRA